MPVIASGGVADLGDILALARAHAEGIEGVITGRAIYDGRLQLADALEIAGRLDVRALQQPVAADDGEQD